MNLKEVILEYQKLNTIIEDLNHSINNDDNLENVTIEYLRLEVIKLRTKLVKFENITVNIDNDFESQPCQPTQSYIIPKPKSENMF